jgi:hypothetical protein
MPSALVSTLWSMPAIHAGGASARDAGGSAARTSAAAPAQAVVEQSGSRSGGAR